jgi:hypothetical protein
MTSCVVCSRRGEGPFLPHRCPPGVHRIIGERVLAGFSLGGHATWLGLRYGASSQSPTINTADEKNARTRSRAEDAHRHPDLRLRGLPRADGAARR